MPDGMNAYGTTLERMGDDGDEYEPIANGTNVSGPGIEREEIETTVHKRADQKDAGWRTFLGGLKDAGEVSIDVNYHPSKHDDLLTDFEDSEPREYRLVFPDKDETAWEFKAFLTGFEPEFPFDDKAEASLTFKVSGKPNLTSGVSTLSVDPPSASLSVGS